MEKQDDEDKEGMPALELPPNATINSENEHSEQNIDEEALFAGSSSDTDEDQPTTPAQPITAATAELPEPPLTPLQTVIPMTASEMQQLQAFVDRDADGEYIVSDTDGEYVVSDTESEGNNMDYTDSDNDDKPPEMDK